LKKEINDPEKLREFIDNNDFGFTKVKTFEQLKAKVLEIRRSYENTKIEVEGNTGNINYLSNKLDDLMDVGEEGKNPTTSEGSKMNIKSQIANMNKKLKYLLGGVTLEDLESQNNEKENINKENKKQILNFEEINRRLMKLQFTKVDNVELDSKNEKIINRIDDVERQMNELIYGLYGQYELHINDNSDKKITFVTKLDFDEYKKNTEDEFGKTCEEIDKIKRTIEIILSLLNEKGSLKDIEDTKNYLLQRFDELMLGLNKKFVERNENAFAFKNLEDQFKKIIVLLATKAEHENDNWLIAKKPINGFSCAACEGFIGELKEEPNNKYIPWNKMPIREREKEQEKEKEKIYRLGNGYSKVLKMVGVDNNGNVTLSPTSSLDVGSFFAGKNDNNNKAKEGFDLQIHKTAYHERVQSANSKNSKEKEKTFDVNKSKIFYDRKLPKIKGSMSTDNLDKIIENPNPNLNIVNLNVNNNVITPKITKILKKTQGKFNI
jgi:hypothetical protein